MEWQLSLPVNRTGEDLPLAPAHLQVEPIIVVCLLASGSLRLVPRQPNNM